MKWLGRNTSAAGATRDGQVRVRVDRRTKNLAKRLLAGEIAVIDHADIDQVAAQSLVACKPSAVLNAAKSTTGRYPNMGPTILVEAGIELIDGLGPEIMDLTEGSYVRLEGGDVYLGESLAASGQRQTEASVAEAFEDSKEGLSHQLEAFAANTMEYLRKERSLLLEGVGVPDVATQMAGKHVLIVVRGYRYNEDLAMLRSYIREYRPVLVGVDGGADALMEAGYKPDMIIGDMDSVTDATLSCGAEIVVHAYRDGTAPGAQRVEKLEIPHVLFPATGTSEDIAMLLADQRDAEMIVAVGTHDTLVEFLDKGRSGMASTFLTRLRVGGKLIDAKGVSRLYKTRISGWHLLWLAVTMAATVVIALTTTSLGQVLTGISWVWLEDFWRTITGLFTGN